MIYSFSDNRARQTQIGNFRSFLPFIPLKAPKIKILKNEKICWRYHHFTHVHQKLQPYDVQFLRFRVRQTKFVTLGHFLPFYLSLMILNIKILKKIKKMPRDIILSYIHVYHKWRSCIIWFLKCKVQQTETHDIWFLRYGAHQT